MLHKQDIKIPYYEDNTRISNSSIGWFLKHGPRYFKDMLDGKEEGLSGKSLEKGEMIHMWLLQKSIFWDNYKIADYQVPSSVNQKTFIDKYTNSFELMYDTKIINAYKESYKVDKLSDDVILQKGTELLELYKDYISSLTHNDNKILITFADLNMLKTIESNIKSHKLANTLLNELDGNNEYHINWEFPKTYGYKPLDCKSLIDRFIIDYDKKKITLIDIKTTVDVYNFHESMDKYEYHRQLAYYWLALQTYFIKDCGLDLFKEDYEFETYIVAIQNNKKYKVRVFKINPKTIELELPKIEYAISEIAWHKKEDKWDYYREYYDGDGSEKLERLIA